MTAEHIMQLADEYATIRQHAHYKNESAARAALLAAVEELVKSEQERICKAIKEEDDYCVTQGDYMLDSDDCIAVANGTWVRPEFAVTMKGQS